MANNRMEAGANPALLTIHSTINKQENNMTYLKTIGEFVGKSFKPEVGWIGEAGEKATPLIRVGLEVAEGPQKGQSIIWNGWLTNAAFDRTITVLKEVFGFDGDLASLQSGKTTLADLPCRFETQDDSYEKNGKTIERVSVRWLNPAGGGMKATDESKVNAIIAKLNARSKAVAKGVPAKAAAPAVAKADDLDNVPE